MNKQLQQWMHERQANIQKARALLDSAEAESRNLSPEEEQRYADLLSAADALQTRIEREHALEAREADLDQLVRSGIKPSSDPTIGMDGKDIRRYSLVRAINAMATGNWRDAQLELEASQAVAQRMGFDPQGLFIPYDWMSTRPEQRDLTKGEPTAGGHTVATDLLSQDFIGLLRNRVILMNAGARMLSGLVGDIAIPRQTGGATAYWVAESNAPDNESQQTFDQAPLSPKTLGAYTDISRKLLKQSSLDIEGFVRGDLAAILGLEIDRAGLHGSGQNNQPTGVAATSGVAAIYAGGAATVGVNANGAAPIWADMVNLETEVAIDNADLGALAYITNAKVRGKLKGTPKVSSTDSIMVWESNDTPLNGYPTWVTNQVSSALSKGGANNLSGIFFGNWADLIIGMWGVLDLLVDPYTNGASGAVRVIALQDVDIAVRHPQSFAAVLDAVTN